MAKSDAEALSVALMNEENFYGFDSIFAIYLFGTLMKLENDGWKFIPPKKEE